jgi:hypothetical protein
MGEAETGSVFESESERSVDADMGEADKADGQQGRPVKLKGRNSERDRTKRCVSRVVDSGADSRARRVAGNAQVGASG